MIAFAAMIKQGVHLSCNLLIQFSLCDHYCDMFGEELLELCLGRAFAQLTAQAVLKVLLTK